MTPGSVNQPHVDYQKTLHDVARTMVRLKKPERLVKLVTRLIDRQISVTHTSLLVLDEQRERFVFIDSKGLKRLPLGFIKVDSHHPLIQWFQNKKRKALFKEDYIDLEAFKAKRDHGSPQTGEGSLQKGMDMILKSLHSLKADLAIPSYFKGTLIGLLLLGKKNNGENFSHDEISFLQILAQDCAMALKTAEYYRNLMKQNEQLEKKVEEIEALRRKEHNTYYEIMRSLAHEINAKDAYTFGHVHQVERLGLLTAKELGYDLSGKNSDILKAALILHDVGKIGIPDHILKKTSRLDQEEWAVMKTHVEKGKKILEHLSAFKEVADIVYSHHENFDGTGYPRGLKGEEIPVEARIVSVVDAFHAIVSTRCYSTGRPAETAFEELTRCGGTQFDPEVVAAFIRGMKKEMKKRGVGFFLEDEGPGAS